MMYFIWWKSLHSVQPDSSCIEAVLLLWCLTHSDLLHSEFLPLRYFSVLLQVSLLRGMVCSDILRSLHCLLNSSLMYIWKPWETPLPVMVSRPHCLNKYLVHCSDGISQCSHSAFVVSVLTSATSDSFNIINLEVSDTIHAASESAWLRRTVQYPAAGSSLYCRNSISKRSCKTTYQMKTSI
jgi:hypothetical protein